METILQRLTELDEIIDAILVGKDGLIVSGILRNEEEEVIGAMSAAAFGVIACASSFAKMKRSTGLRTQALFFTSGKGGRTAGRKDQCFWY